MFISAENCNFACRMIRKRSLIWFLAALSAVCLAVIIHGHGLDAVPEQALSEFSDSSVLTSLHNQQHEATLTDASILYRICSSRPHRIQPVQGYKSERSQSSALHLVRRHIVGLLHSYFDSRCRKESAPYCQPSSCDYYVIALRHIIR